MHYSLFDIQHMRCMLTSPKEKHKRGCGRPTSSQLWHLTCYTHVYRIQLMITQKMHLKSLYKKLNCKITTNTRCLKTKPLIFSLFCSHEYFVGKKRQKTFDIWRRFVPYKQFNPFVRLHTNQVQLNITVSAHSQLLVYCTLKLTSLTKWS